jgi:KaiC/GvpD/RAD55 family RecA-like ATPase
MADDAKRAAGTRANRVSGPWVATHDVQFYENDQFLVDSVARYLVEGVQLGQPIVVIATPAHRRGFFNRMRELGVDPDMLVQGRDAVFLDAAETLSAFMEGRMPSEELFELTVGDVFAKLGRDRPYLMVRAYGEMVDLLWREGKAEAAIQLEQMWNRLSERYSFSLLCAYEDKTLNDATGTPCVKDICHAHTRVLPAESAPLAQRLGLGMS